jgi:hypothetical protein
MLKSKRRRRPVPRTTNPPGDIPANASIMPGAIHIQPSQDWVFYIFLSYCRSSGAIFWSTIYNGFNIHNPVPSGRGQECSLPSTRRNSIVHRSSKLSSGGRITSSTRKSFLSFGISNLVFTQRYTVQNQMNLIISRRESEHAFKTE